MKKFILALALFALTFSFFVSAADWSSWQNTEANTGLTADNGPATSHLSTIITVSPTRPLFQPIIVGTTMYVASMDGFVRAYNLNNGRLILTSADLNAAASGLSTPAHDNGFIYVSAQNATVFKLNAATLTTVAQSNTLAGTPESVTIDTTNSLIHVSVSGAADFTYGLNMADLLLQV